MKDLKENKSVYIGIGIVIIIVCVIGCFLIEKKRDNSEYGTVETNSIITSEKTEETESKKIYVYVVGQVNNPGVIEAYAGDRLKTIIEMAGGFSSEANIEKVNLAYEVEDGQKIIIPNIHDTEDLDENYIMTGAGANVVEGNSYGSKVNINKATQTELETLTGIGPSMASKIIEYRNKNGRFDKIEDLKNVPGIGESKYESIKDSIIVK